ncbi:hypothetical protein WMO40_20760 [Bacillaceae bacterium CLA-AA-H227]|uniref:Uncharacterized protein n=2 Tax=Robertmurraya TaxID=2837507 RepID=A0A4U1CZM6_9BACI|nr:hypothetical protein [Robertmurraya kyonggiensis]TKC15204.1 hypothetical protein FA727_20190 [Robertmurraya kyonggiensis]
MFSLVAPNLTSAENAGLLWKSKRFGDNLVVSITNVHKGWAGPKFPRNNTPHVNVHVDKLNSYNNRVAKEIANYHVVKYKKQNKSCIYIYESKKNKTVMDQCATSWNTLVSKATSAMKSFAQAISPNDNFTLIAVFSAAAVMIYKLITSFIPVYPSDAIPDGEIVYTEADYITEAQPSNDLTGYIEETADGLYDSIQEDVPISDLPTLTETSIDNVENINTLYVSPANDTLKVTLDVGGNNSDLDLDILNEVPRFTIENSVGTIVKTGTMGTFIRRLSVNNIYEYEYRNTVNISTSDLPAGDYRIKIYMFKSIFPEIFPELTQQFYINTNRTITNFSS